MGRTVGTDMLCVYMNGAALYELRRKVTNFFADTLAGGRKFFSSHLAIGFQ